MKLSALFAKYLYQHKTLNLPGIGVFSIDPSVTVPDTSDKLFADFLQQIRYTQKAVAAPDEEFINFIRTETGKIKPLAESDLDSFLSDGKILLNIGKPFHIEGIGSLQKKKEGVYEFTAGETIPGRMEALYDHRDEEVKKKTLYTDNIPQSNSLGKLLLVAGAVIGVILIVWGGYSLYNRNTASEETSSEKEALLSDTSRANIILDSVKSMIDSSLSTPEPATAAGTYRYVIERTANKNRALKRFAQLKDNRADIKMATKDSTLFSLYLIIPSSPSDTTRIKDSLKMWYGRKEVFVEK